MAAALAKRMANMTATDEDGNEGSEEGGVVSEDQGGGDAPPSPPPAPPPPTGADGSGGSSALLERPDSDSGQAAADVPDPLPGASDAVSPRPC